MSTEVSVPALTVEQQVVAAFAKCKTEKELTELAAKHVDIKAITNEAGRDQVHAARMVLKNTRVEVQKFCEEVRETAVKFGKGVIAEQKRLIGLIEPEETRLEKLQKAWDDAEEEKRLAAVKAEEERVKALQERVAELSGALGVAKRYNLTAAQFAEHIADLERIPVDDTFAEFKAEAETAKAATLVTLREMHGAADAREKEAAQIKADREELDRQKAAQKKIDDAAKVERDAEAARQNEALRKQQADLAEIAERNQMRMSELQGIQHQVMIASVGRAGVRRGGTRECITQTLAETEGWEITEEKFGPLLASAQSVKASAVAAIRSSLEQFDQRAEQAAESKRLADAAADLARQQEALRKAQEPPPAPPPPPPAPVSRRGVAVPVPTRDEMVKVLANHYRAKPDTIIDWLRAIDWARAEAA